MELKSGPKQAGADEKLEDHSISPEVAEQFRRIVFIHSVQKAALSCSEFPNNELKLTNGTLLKANFTLGDFVKEGQIFPIFFNGHSVTSSQEAALRKESGGATWGLDQIVNEIQNGIDQRGPVWTIISQEQFTGVTQEILKQVFLELDAF